MTLKTLIRLMVALALGGGSAIIGAGAASATVPSPVTCENVKGSPVHSVNSDIANRPDSAHAPGVGTWALDRFKRHADVYVIDKHDAPPAPTAKKVEVTSYTYLVCGVDNGSFITQGGKSPQKGLPMKNGMKGTFSGKWSLKVEAPSEGYFVQPTNTNTLGTEAWIDKLWSQGDKPVEKFTHWAWTYLLCKCDKRHFGDVQWINKYTGNLGDIRTDKWCPHPSPSPSLTPTIPATTQPAGTTPTAGNGTPSLPVTGTKEVVIVSAGVVAVSIGVILFIVARRRRVRFEV